MPTVNVTINGNNYRMACDEGQEEHLEKLGSEFDNYVHQLKSSFGEIGDQRLTVMAGVMITDEMLELKRKVDSLEQELKKVKETGALQNRERQEGDDDLARNIIDVAKKIEKLNTRLAI